MYIKRRDPPSVRMRRRVPHRQWRKPRTFPSLLAGCSTELSRRVGAQTPKQMKQEQQNPLCSLGLPVCLCFSRSLCVSPWVPLPV